MSSIECRALLDGKVFSSQAVLDSSPEGIVVTDDQGNIVYANEAYSRICSNDRLGRMGSNVLASNPEGALTEVLHTGKPVVGNRHRPPGSKVDVVAHAYPIMLGEKLVGAAAFFREANQALEILDRLAKAQERVDILNKKIGSLGRSRHTFSSIVGKGESFRKAIVMAVKAASTNSTVLLRGESGTGKDLFAAAIHNASRRSHQPFVQVNCAAIPETLLESEFFGYEKGSFTGASRRKVGTLELADKGTLFLDEIGDMDLKLQAKLLDALQNRQFRRLGGSSTIKVDVRVIAATNRNLEDLIEKGLFREDLYFRLHVVVINIPPLREHKEDIPLLIDHLLKKIGRRIGKQPAGIDEGAYRLLRDYCWPGNVRELENVLERALTLSEAGRPLTEYDIVLPSIGPRKGYKTGTLMEMEQAAIEEALKKYGTSLKAKRAIAQSLGISLTTLYAKIKKMNLNR